MSWPSNPVRPGAPAMIQHHDKKAAERHGSTLAAAAFETWLRQRIEADGHSLTAIAAAAGVDYQALRNPLIGRTARPTLSNVRLLALHFGDDPEEIAALAGYPNPTATCPEPSEFPTFDGWLRAVLQVRHETRRHASVAVGLSEHVCRHILAGQPPEWNTVALL